MAQLIHLDDQVEFSIANSIWYRLGFEVLSEFTATNQEYFDALVSELDFSDPWSVEIINQWIEDKTNGKIKDMLVLLPAYGVTTADLIEQMDVSNWNAWFEQSETINVQVELPKFRYIFKSLLNDPLTNPSCMLSGRTLRVRFCSWVRWENRSIRLMSKH